MRSFFDDTGTVFDLGLAGLAAGRGDIHRDPGGFLALDDPGPGVAVLSGGGSGHEPLHAGFLGRGMLAAVCPGRVFTSPNARQILAATRAVDRGAGVLHVVKNYTGDVMNFGVAARLAAAEGIRVETVLVADDLATSLGDSGGDGSGPGRRGTAATILVEKACGAAAARGADLDEVARVGRRVAAGAASLAVSVGGAGVPGGAGSLELGADEVEFGVGIHGERGVERRDRRDIREAVADMVAAAHAAAGSPDRCLLLVNGLGGLAGLELSAILVLAAGALEDRGARVARTMCGDFVTAWAMPGFSVTVLGVDDELLGLLDEPTTAPGWAAPARWRGAAAPAAGEDLAPARARGPIQAELTAWRDRVLAARDELTELDRRAGDGDFGDNMAAALGAVPSPLRGDLAGALGALGESYLVHAGGTSGAVFGLFLSTMAARAGAAAGPAEADLAVLARAGLDAVVDLGGARVGDGTVVDAIEPAVRALEEGAAPAAAAEAARAGAAATADLVAGKGRASYVVEAARGVLDPGALVMAWFFEELAG